MFKNLIRKLSGVKSYKELLDTSIGIVRAYADNHDSAVGSVARNEELFRSWVDYIKPDNHIEGPPIRNFSDKIEVSN